MSQLTLITNEAFSRPFKPSCTVKMDKEVEVYNDFVVVGHNVESGQTSILLNADAVTLGQALQLISKVFNDEMVKLSPEDRVAVQDYLTGGVQFV